MRLLDAVVIGAGQAGLATAYALQSAGLCYQILEATGRAAGSWPSYYESLKLFSPARYSSLPGMTFPGDSDRYPYRDEVIDYLESYAKKFGFPIIYDTRVNSVARDVDSFLVSNEKGDVLRARSVVVTSGPFNQPNIPAFKGLNDFRGKLLHSSQYRQPADVIGRSVAVVGAGNSAVQIAYELSAQHKVTLISRQPPVFMNQRPFGRDIHFWLRATGFDMLPVGDWFGWKLTEPVLDQGMYRHAFKNGRLVHRPLFDSVTSDGLFWGDSAQPFDTLLLATGFVSRPEFLEDLDGLSALEASQQRGGVSLKVPGLYFVGVPWQRSHASSTLRGVGADAAFVVKHLKRRLNASDPLPIQRMKRLS
jgi:putative flavoprotein involved in K+ transport